MKRLHTVFTEYQTAIDRCHFFTTLKLAATGVILTVALCHSPRTNAALLVESNLTLSPSFRVDNLDWNIAGDEYGNAPNVLSELKWTSLTSLQMQLSSEIMVNRILYLKGFGNYGFIFDGDNQDSDYLGDNRTQEFSRSNNDAGDGNVNDVGFSLGMVLVFYDDDAGGTMTFIPQLGYSVHQQNLRSTNGKQTIPPIGPFPGLNSEYNAQWDGPWLGLDFRIQSSWTSALHFRYEFHKADYYADANWNLRDDLAHPLSFEHNATGTGQILALGWRQELNNDWLIGVELLWQRWSADNGKDRLFFSDGGNSVTRLNEVNWSSTSLTLTLGKFFPLH